MIRAFLNSGEDVWTWIILFLIVFVDALCRSLELHIVSLCGYTVGRVVAVYSCGVVGPVGDERHVRWDFCEFVGVYLVSDWWAYDGLNMPPLDARALVAHLRVKLSGTYFRAHVWLSLGFQTEIRKSDKPLSSVCDYRFKLSLTTLYRDTPADDV